tara:strand:- start:43 stop:522 length:480 start_codon:yes stop_codon:yes gene_type:complete
VWLQAPKLGDYCRRCGIEISSGLVADSCCTNCRLSPPSFDSCTCVFPHVSPIDKLVADFKFSDRFDIGYSLSRFLARTFNAYYIGPAKPEQLIPAPLHRNRLDSRGFNQASEIGNVLAKHCGVLNLPLRHMQDTKYTAADFDEFGRRQKGKLAQGIRHE